MVQEVMTFLRAFCFTSDLENTSNTVTSPIQKCGKYQVEGTFLHRGTSRRRQHINRVPLAGRVAWKGWVGMDWQDGRLLPGQGFPWERTGRRGEQGGRAGCPARWHV